MAPAFLGRLLQSRTADRSLSVWEKLQGLPGIVITSPSFVDGQPIPKRHAGSGVGENVSPALEWHGVPIEADHLVLVIEDVDVPFARPLIHTMTIIDADATALAEGALAKGAPGVEHLKGLFGSGYRGPRPIVGHGPHHYRFMIFAVEGDIDTTSQKTAVESMEGRILARGRLTGTYER